MPAVSGSEPVAFSLTLSMPVSLIPRWQFMTDEAKALARRTAVSAAVVVAVLLLFRALLPWVVLGLIGWWIWKAISK
jgi:hypothetical protein